MSVVLRTERLVVRHWELSDSARYYQTYSRWDVMRYLGSDPTPLESLARAEAITLRLSRPGPDPTYGIWAVCRREDLARPLGSVLLVPVPGADDGAVEVGWHLHPDAWGQGYATEAAGAVLERGFAAGLEEVIALTYPENTPSQAVCRRLGMDDRGMTARYYGITARLFALRAGDPARSAEHPSP